MCGSGRGSRCCCIEGWTSVPTINDEWTVNDGPNLLKYASNSDSIITQSGWKVADPEQPGTLVDIRPRHICLLFRRFINYGRDLPLAQGVRFDVGEA